jgi:hypothetical protein
MRLPAAVRHMVTTMLGLIVAAPAFAGWGPAPSQIRSTTETIRSIAARSDGAFGAFVAWQESTYAQGRLRAQHVLATGDVDPAWPVDGALACATVLARKSLDVFADGSGGAYLLWSEPGAIKVLRLDAAGNTAVGWPACGLAIGAGMDPVGLADGTGALYVGWTRTGGASPDPSTPALQRLDANGVAPGWPSGGRDLSDPDPVATADVWMRLALAPGGGVYASWVTMSLDTLTVPSAAWLARITPDGEPAPGWPSPGIALAPFRWESPGVSFAVPLIDIAPDGRGGVFHIIESPYVFVPPPPYQQYTATFLDIRLRRVQTDGVSSSGWPSDGMLICGQCFLPNGFPDEAPHLLYDDDEGVFVGTATYATEGYMATDYRRWTDAGAGGHFGTANPLQEKSVVKSQGGGLFLGSFFPNGPFGYWSPNAKLEVIQCPALPGWSDFRESHTEYGSSWFGDIALVPTGDGGAIFFWSQHNQIFGLFARRFGGGGGVVDVPDPFGSESSLHASFAPGIGVRAAGLLDGAGVADLGLFDLSGRRAAVLRVARPGAFDVVLPGTSSLGCGVYFLRARAGTEIRTARVAVIR